MKDHMLRKPEYVAIHDVVAEKTEPLLDELLKIARDYPSMALTLMHHVVETAYKISPENVADAAKHVHVYMEKEPYYRKDASWNKDSQ